MELVEIFLNNNLLIAAMDKLVTVIITVVMEVKWMIHSDILQKQDFVPNLLIPIKLKMTLVTVLQILAQKTLSQLVLYLL